MNQKICNAIKEKRILSFNYDGGARKVEPFCHGRSSKGIELLRGYQIGGYSRSGKPVGWRLFYVSKISSISITDKIFKGDRPRYKPRDSAMSVIFCKV